MTKRQNYFLGGLEKAKPGNPAHLQQHTSHLPVGRRGRRTPKFYWNACTNQIESLHQHPSSPRRHLSFYVSLSLLCLSLSLSFSFSLYFFSLSSFLSLSLSIFFLFLSLFLALSLTSLFLSVHTFLSPPGC